MRQSNCFVNQNPVTSKLFTADLSQVFCGSEPSRWTSDKIGIQAASSLDKKFELTPVAAPKERGFGSTVHQDARTLDTFNASSVSSITKDSTIDNSEQIVDRQRLVDTSLADQNRCVVSTLEESNASSKTEDFSQRSEASSSYINQTNIKHHCGNSDVVSKLDNLDISSTSSLSELSLSKSGKRKRRKSKPLHRCSILNHSLSSIIKPSRFSSTSDSAPREQDTTTTLSNNESLSRSSSPCGASVGPWTSNEVAFSSSVEVYVFRS